MMFCVLIEHHPMIGVDLHGELTTTLPPVEVPLAPHLTAATLNWVVPPAMTTKTFATFLHARIMQRGTDIQNLIPHIPLAPPAVALAPILMAFSGSKSYFGPRSVQVEGTPVAVALYGVVSANLNCGDIPLPSGVVIAPNTVVAGMTLGDILGAFMAMAFDAVMQAAINKLFSGMGSTPSAAIAGGFMGTFLGTPLGFSLNANGHGLPGIVGRLLGIRSDLSRNIGETIGETLTGGDTKPMAEDRQQMWEKLKGEAKGLAADPYNTKTLPGEEGKGDIDKAKQIPGNLPPVRLVKGLSSLGDNPNAEAF